MLPKLIHFVFGMTKQTGRGDFGLHHYICLKSAHDLHPHHQLLLWHAFEPTDNPYWEAASRLCRKVKIVEPTEVFGNPLRLHAHRTDVVRLKLLDEYGGAYADLDSIFVKPIDDIFVRHTLMGFETDDIAGKTYGLCNALILSLPRASFIRRWYECFEFFFSPGYDAAYAFFAVRLPLILARQRADDIDIVSHKRFFPFWCDEQGLNRIFVDDTPLPDETVSLHLWESQAKMRGHIQNITAETLFGAPTLYSRIASRHVTQEEVAALSAGS